jgi:hypothetical protein
MLSTLRIWKWTAMVDNDYNPGLFRNLLLNWPWRTPCYILESWKYSHSAWGGKYFLKRRMENFLASFEWCIPTKRTLEQRRECRKVYLEARIDVLETLIRDLEESANADSIREMSVDG